MVEGMEERAKPLLQRLVEDHCGKTLEVLYYVTPACSSGGGGGEEKEACVCRVKDNGSDRAAAPTTSSVILRLHAPVCATGKGGGNATGAGEVGPKADGGESGEGAKLWDFLEELRVGSGDAERWSVARPGAPSSTATEREIALLPLTDASLCEVLSSHEEQTMDSFAGGDTSTAAPPSRGSYYLHPNILTPLAFFEARGGHVLSVYSHAGTSLSSALKYSTPGFLSWATVGLMIYQIAQLVKFCHERGLYFGDLSTSKVFVNDQALVFALVDYRKVCGATSAPQDGERGAPGRSSEAVRELSDGFKAWRLGAMSNFDYLMMLNSACGRERGNLDFYPVLPWVIDMMADPSADEDVDGGDGDGGTWRDLTKTKWRLAKGDLQLDMTYISSLPPHHVSDEALSELTVCVYLARRLQKTVLTNVVRAVFEPREYPSTMARMYNWTPDEAIPDFYDNPEIFSSIHGEMSDLCVPDWAPSAEDFVRRHRAALESPRVSAHLHRWIDLTFGCALFGRQAIENKNVHLPPKDTWLPTARGRFQIFTERHPPRGLPSPIAGPRLATDLAVFQQETVQGFMARQFSFCSSGGSSGAEGGEENEGSARMRDIFFVCQAAFVVFSSRKRDVLISDVGGGGVWSDKGRKILDPQAMVATQDLFPALLQRYVQGLLSTSLSTSMDQVIQCPSFESSIKDTYRLMALANHPGVEISQKLWKILCTLRSQLADPATDRGLYVIVFRTLLDILRLPSVGRYAPGSPRGPTRQAMPPGEEMGENLVEIFAILLRELPAEVSRDFFIPFLVSAIQGSSQGTKVLPSGSRLLALDLTGVLFTPNFILRVFRLLGARPFFKSIFPKILEMVGAPQRKAEKPRIRSLSAILIKLVEALPLPVAVKQVLDPMLNLLYHHEDFMILVLRVSRHLGDTFVRCQLYPRLVEIVKKGILSTGKTQRARQRVFRPPPQVSDHLTCSLTLLRAIISRMDAQVVMRGLIADTLHREVQQPGILFQALLIPYPDYAVLSLTADLLVEGSRMGGGREYLERTLLPTLEPIFYVSEDDPPRSDYLLAISYLYQRLCAEIGIGKVTDATSEWQSIERIRSCQAMAQEGGRPSLPEEDGHEETFGFSARDPQKKSASYSWLRQSEGKAVVLPFAPVMPEGIKVSPETYVTSLDDNSLGSADKFKCVHHQKLGVSKIRIMVAEEMGDLVFAAGSASSSSSAPVIRAFNLAQERTERVYVNHTGAVTGLCSLNQGAVVASCDSNGLVNLWYPEASTRAEAAVYRVREGGIEYGMDAPSGGQVACGCACMCKAWEEDGDGGTQVLVGTAKGCVHLFDVRAQRPSGVFRAGGQAAVTAMAASGGEGPRQVCAAFSDGTACLLGASGKICAHFDVGRGGDAVSCCAFAREHYLLAGSGKEVLVLDRRMVGGGGKGPVKRITSLKGGAPTGLYPVGAKILVTWGHRMQVLDPAHPEGNLNPRPFKLKNSLGVKESTNISGVGLMGLSHTLVVGNEEKVLFYSF